MQRLEIGVHIRDVPFGGDTVAEVVRRTRDDQSVRAFACDQRILHRLTHDGTHQAAKTTGKLERIALRFHPGASFFALHNRLWIAFQRANSKPASRIVASKMLWVANRTVYPAFCKPS